MLGGERLRGRAEGADATGQEQDAVGEGAGEVEVVRGEEDTRATLALTIDRLEDRPLRRCVDGGERLVEEEHRRLLRQGPGKEHPLALAAGEGAERLAALIAEPDTPERMQGRRALVGANTPERSWRRGTLQHDIEGRHRELGLRGAVLRDERHSTGAFYTPPGREEVEQREKERGLPGRVRPDDRDDLARPKVEVDVVEDDAPSALDGQTLDLQQWFCGQPLRPSAMRSTLPRIMPR